MNKWQRPQSPSAIPRLLRNYAITSPSESPSDSPSPVNKTTPGTRIPTPTGFRGRTSTGGSICSSNQDLSRNSSKEHVNRVEGNEVLKADKFYNFDMDQELDFGSSFNLGNPLEEISLPSSPLPNSSSPLEVVVKGEDSKNEKKSESMFNFYFYIQLPVIKICNEEES